MDRLIPLTFVMTALTVSLLPTGLFVSLALWKRRMRGRRSPLTTELHHLPGEFVRSRAEHLMETASDRLFLITSVGPIVLAAWALWKADLHHLRLGWSEAVLLLVIALVATWGARSAVKLLERRRQYLDALAAERATAQELAPLIGKGCAIYHDVPAKDFNLDHVVIGPDKAYVVETKSRQKPAGPGNANARVKFDGDALHFPDWRDTKMLDQARAEARWLSEYLYRKTGERVPVEPVLALPGWFVTRTIETPDVHVINPKMHDFMAATAGKPISDAQRRRIMTALEERYRITEPDAALAEYHG